MSHNQERVEYPPNDAAWHTSSSNPQKSRAPPPPIHGNPQQGREYKNAPEQSTPRSSNHPPPDNNHPRQSDQNRKPGQYENYDNRRSESQPTAPTRPSRSSRSHQQSNNTNITVTAQPRGNQSAETKHNQPSQSRSHHNSRSNLSEPPPQRQNQTSSIRNEEQRSVPGRSTSNQYPNPNQTGAPSSSNKHRSERNSNPNKAQENTYERKHAENTKIKSQSAGKPQDPRIYRQEPSSSTSRNDLNSIQVDINPTPKTSTSWQPRAQRLDPGGQKYQSQHDLSATSYNDLSKSQQHLSRGPPIHSTTSSNLAKAQSTLEIASHNPVNLDVKEDGGKQNHQRKYQRNSAPQGSNNRQSRHLGNVPASSTQSLHMAPSSSQNLGNVNPALVRSAVSLNPSANPVVGGSLAGQADLGLSASRMSLATQSISRNPSLSSLVASNPSLYRTVSAFSLYEAGQAEPSSYLPVTIAGCILCCPIGVIGILFSIMARDALAVKDYPTAVRWGSIALWTGVAFIIGGIVLIITLALILGLYFS